MKLLYCLLVFQFTGPILLSQESFFFKHTIKSGFPSNTIYYGMQDSDGFMWFSTDLGICQYDGNKVTTYLPQDGLTDSEIFQIHEDSQKRIWFFPFNGRLCYLKQGVFYNSTNDKLLSKLNIKGLYSSFFEDKHHRLWFGTQHRGLLILSSNGELIKPDFITGAIFHIWKDDKIVYALAENGLYQINEDDPMQGFQKLAFEFYGQGRDVSKKSYVDTLSHLMYYPNSNHGLSIIDYIHGEIKTVQNDKAFNGVYFSLNKKKWIYSNSGLNALEEEDKNEEFATILPGAAISFMLQDKEGGYWITTLNQGVYYSPTFSLKYYPISEGHEENQFYRIFKNKDNNIWAIKKEGAYAIINPEQNKISTFPSLLPSKILVRDAKLINDTIFISSSRGLLTLSDKFRCLYFSNVAIKSFSKRNDRLWLSTGISGLREYNFRKVKESGYLTKNPLKNGFQIFPDRTFHVFAEENADKNRVWYGTQDGLMMYENKKIRNISHLHPYLRNRISQIKQDDHGNLWVVVEATGIVILNSQLEIIGDIGKQIKLFKEHCKRLFIEEGKIWFITDHTLYRTEIVNEEIYIKTVLFLKNEILNDLFIDHNNIWLASTAGLLFIPKSFKLNQEVNVKLQSIFINSKKVKIPPDSLIEVSHDNNNLKINFAGISYSSNSPLYRYKFSQKDPTWTYTRSGDLEFPSLPPGFYHFEIQARNSDWSWNQQLGSFQLWIKKPLWLEWWFLLLIGLILITLISWVTWKISQEKLIKIVLQEQLLESEFKALMAQMNPHFIFNTLNTIQRFFITQETKTANKILIQFSNLMRMTLEHTLKSFITIEDEICYLKNYLEIEQTRFNQNFSFLITVQDTIDPALVSIPSMILQPFVENSIIHGFPSKKEAGEIKISFYRQNEMLKIIIDDNGLGRKQTTNKDHTSRGINLIKERLNILNNKNATNYSLQIIDKKSPLHGTIVEINL